MRWYLVLSNANKIMSFFIECRFNLLLLACIEIDHKEDFSI